MLVDRIEVPLWTPFGELTSTSTRRPTIPPKPHNDNARPIMIGLTGLRTAGKTTVAKLLEEELGFVRIHAFGAGREAARAYFCAITGDHSLAEEMVYGSLKDTPSSHLPDEVTPRYFLERLGQFMGVDLGVDWTLGMEIAMAQRVFPGRPIIVESLVYEADWFKRRGGVVWRIERPGHVGPTGCESDAVQAAVAADVTIVARDVWELRALAFNAAQQMMGGG